MGFPLEGESTNAGVFHAAVTWDPLNKSRGRDDG
jgi:hypothetical protein